MMPAKHTTAQNTAAPKATMTPRRAKRVNVVVVGLIVAVLAGAGAWLVVRQYQLHQERQKFLTAAADLHALAQQIAETAGQPDQQKAVQSCRYQSEKYSRGARSCTVDTFAVYYVTDEEAAQRETRTVVDALSSTRAISNVQIHPQSVPVNELADVSFSMGDFSSCGAGYQFFSRGQYAYYHEAFKFIVQQPMLVVEYGCSSSAKAEYFPVEN